MNPSTQYPEFEGYSVLEKLGQGGMGVVYKVRNLKLDRVEALKIISPAFGQQTQLLRRFEQEAKALARIHHSNIVTIYALQESLAGQYITMEYVDGKTIGERIEKVGVFDLKSSTDIVEQLLAAFAYAHKEGVLHRDIKPNNIMLTPENQVKVMDFGLAKLYLNQDKTQSTHQAGTLAYMSPEQIKGEKLDQRSDIFAIGMTLYEMFSGRLPFDKDLRLFKIQRLIVEQEFSPPKEFNKNIPEGLSSVIMKALQKAPEDRYHSASDMLDAFKSFCKTVEHREHIQETKISPHLSSEPVTQEKKRSESVQATELNSTWSSGSTFPLAENNETIEVTDGASGLNKESVASGKSIRRVSLVFVAILLVSGTVWASISWGPSMLQRWNFSEPTELTEDVNNATLGNQQPPQGIDTKADVLTETQDPLLGVTEDSTKGVDPDEFLAQNETSREQLDGNAPPSNEVEDGEQAEDRNEEELALSGPSPDQDSLVTGADLDSLVVSTDESEDDSSSLELPQAQRDVPAQEPELEKAPVMSFEESVRAELAQWDLSLSEAIISGNWDGMPAPVVDYYQNNIEKLKRNFNVLAATSHIDDSVSFFSDEESRVVITTRIEYQQKGREDRQSLPMPAAWIWERRGETITLVDVREK